MFHTIQNIKITNSKHLILILHILLISLGCKIFSPVYTIQASDPKVGIEIPADGQVLDQQKISSEVTIIYFEFFLDAPENSQVNINVKWYHQSTLIYEYNGTHPKGYNIVTLERDASIIPEFEVGEYRVEVWFLNTMLAYDIFEIQK